MVTVLSDNFDEPRRLAALAELEHLMAHALTTAVAGTAGELTVTSTLRGQHYTVVTVGGTIDARAIHLLTAHFAGLLNVGTRHLLVDLSGVDHPDDSLLELMRRVENKQVALNGLFELTGLAPPTLHAMDDESLAEVFALYRTTLEDAKPSTLLWSALRCPEGLDDVPEPGSAARYRATIDTAAHGRGERWGRRR